MRMDIKTPGYSGCFDADMAISAAGQPSPAELAALDLQAMAQRIEA